MLYCLYCLLLPTTINEFGITTAHNTCSHLHTHTHTHKRTTTDTDCWPQNDWCCCCCCFSTRWLKNSAHIVNAYHTHAASIAADAAAALLSHSGSWHIRYIENQRHLDGNNFRPTRQSSQPANQPTNILYTYTYPSIHTHT